jgi:flagellar biogenesis protein FliO
MPSAALASTAVKPLTDVSVGHVLLQMVLALAVIVGSILLLTKLLARIKNGSKHSIRQVQGTKGLAILSRQSLGKDLSIATVRWGDREVLVGISGTTITFLNEARAEDRPEKDAGANGFAQAGNGSSETPSFSPALLAAAARGLIDRPSASMTTRTSLLDQLRNATVRR